MLGRLFMLLVTPHMSLFSLRELERSPLLEWRIDASLTRDPEGKGNDGTQEKKLHPQKTYQQACFESGVTSSHNISLRVRRLRECGKSVLGQ